MRCVCLSGDKIRNPQPFTERQIRLLETIREKIRQINDPDPDIITHDSYEFHIEQTKQFGKIPKIKFRPNSGQIKARIIEIAGLIDESQNDKRAEIRKKFGIKEARNRKANLFESEWNNIMLKAKKATVVAAYINQLFAAHTQTIAKPMYLIQTIIQDEYKDQIKAKKEIIHSKDKPDTQENKRFRSYEEELMEIE
ncbi:hypothetical protein ACFLZE_04365 [Thermodesulfobacteriota bacterium]